MKFTVFIFTKFFAIGVSENVLETWQKNNHTFKKTEYTMKLEVAGKTYYGSANTKKAAKTAVATEAWNILRTGTMTATSS